MKERHRKMRSLGRNQKRWMLPAWGERLSRKQTGSSVGLSGGWEAEGWAKISRTGEREAWEQRPLQQLCAVEYHTGKDVGCREGLRGLQILSHSSWETQASIDVGICKKVSRSQKHSLETPQGWLYLLLVVCEASALEETFLWLTITPSWLCTYQAKPSVD